MTIVLTCLLKHRSFVQLYRTQMIDGLTDGLIDGLIDY